MLGTSPGRLGRIGASTPSKGEGAPPFYAMVSNGYAVVSNSKYVLGRGSN